MKLGKLFVMVLIAGLCIAPVMRAQAAGTQDEAKTMALKAKALIKEVGIDKASKRFVDKAGGFIADDLYVFVLDPRGTFVAHGARPALIGKGGLSMVDPTGFPLIKAFLDVKEAGWVDYKWPDASDGNKIKDKSSYIINMGDYILGVGYYKS